MYESGKSKRRRNSVLPRSGSGLGLSIAINSRRDELLMRRWPGYLGLTDQCHRLCHLLKIIRSTDNLRHTMLEARRVKEERRRKYIRAGDLK